jgi:monoamine oxidase
MNRRQFAKLGSSSLLWPLLVACGSAPNAVSPTPTLRQNPTVTPDQPLSVVVVGAGIAGLAAARTLHDQGLKVTMLEARDQVGGRLRVDRSAGVAFDEGASWIHGPNGNPITPLAAAAGATTYLTDDDSTVVYDIDGTAYADQVLIDAEEDYEAALEAVAEQATLDQGFAEVFTQLYPDRSTDRLWKYMLSAYLEFSTGASWSQLSASQFDDDELFDGADLLITNGYDRVATHLAHGLDLRLSEAVRFIDMTGTEAVVQTNRASYTADVVVVAVPLGVLKQQRIQFLPALPATKQTAINRLQMGTVNKFLLLWDTAFWETELQYIGFTPETQGQFNYFLNFRTFSEVNALMTFAFGEYAIQSEQLSDAEIIMAVMAHLQAIYGDNLPLPRRLLRTRWSQDPHTFGSYSFATVGVPTSDFDVLAEPVNSQLFFCGEHTERDYRGTVHGAYLSGLREAQRILDL